MGFDFLFFFNFAKINHNYLFFLIFCGEKMSCYKYWGKIEEIADKLSSYGDLDSEGLSALDGTDIDEITKILDEIEVIAHDKEIDFDSAKHILDDEKMNKALQLIRKFYVYIGARLETENAKKILESDDPKAVLDSFHFYCIGIEQFEEVADLSRKVLKRLELDDGIEIITGNEKTIADLDYDILMIAAFAEPKDRVFANIWEVVDEKTPVLYRTYTGMRAILYAPVTDKDTRGFHQEVMLLPRGKTNNTSVLIRKIV